MSLPYRLQVLPLRRWARPLRALAVLAASLVPACSAGSPAPDGSRCSPPDLIGPLGFEEGMLPVSGDAPTYWVPRYEGGRIVDDATAAGGKAFRKDWVANAGSEENSNISAVLAQGVTRVYARWRYKQAATFENRGIIKKMFRTQAPGFNGLLGTLIIKDNRYVWFYDQLDAFTNYLVNVGSEVGYTPNELRGGWHTFEVMNDISSSGALRARLWIDGVLKMDHTVAKSNLGRTIGVVEFNGTFNLPGQNATDWLDELAVSSSCIGN